MSAADLRIGSVLLVCQLSGVQVPPYGPTPYPTLSNNTPDYDLFAGDIGVLFDMGAGKTGILFGDCYGSEWGGGFNIAKTRLSATTKRLLDSYYSFVTVDVTDYAPGGIREGLQIFLNSVTDIPQSGYIHVQVGGPGGWSTFSYNGTTTGGIGPAVLDVHLICGAGVLTRSGTTNPVVAFGGDPRTNGGYRGNLFATSTDTTLGDGLTINAMLTHPDGCAIEPFPFTINPGVRGDVFRRYQTPPVASPVLRIASVERRSGILYVEFVDPHGLPTGKPKPSGPPVLVGGWVNNTATYTGPIQHTINATSYTFNDISGWAPTSASAAAKRFVITNLDGQATIAYTTKVDNQTVEGCTFQATGKSVSGFTGFGATAVQGVDKDGNGRSFEERDFMLLDVGVGLPGQDPTKVVRFIDPNPFNTPDRAGGVLPFSFAHLPDAISVDDPVNAKHAGLFPVGAVSVPHVGATGGYRHVAYVLNSLYNGEALTYSNATETWYSDTGGTTSTWTRASTGVFPNNYTQNALVTAIHPYHDADDVCGYGFDHVDFLASPCGVVGRYAVGDELDASLYEFFMGGDPLNPANWSNDPADGQHIGWTYPFGAQAGPVTSCSLSYLPESEAWVCVYNAHPNGVQVQARLADTLTGTWGTALRVADGNDFPGNGYTYASWVHPRSQVAPNDPNAFFVTVTIINPYQVFLLKVPLVDPGGVDNNVEDQTDTLVFNPALKGAIAEWDSWMTDTHPWVRTGTHTFTINTNATSYLRPGTRISYNDGTVDYGVVASSSHNAGTTTVTLITNTDYSMANVTITARRYSHAASPPGFPSAFNYTPTLTGYSTNPTDAIYQWTVDNDGWIIVSIREVTAGTKNGTATSPTYTLPVAAKTLTNGAWIGPSIILNNNATQSNAASLIVTSAGTTLTASSAFALTNTWTANSLCRVSNGSVRYPFA